MKRIISNLIGMEPITLLDLAHYKHVTIQAVCEEIRQKLGRVIPCSTTTVIDDLTARKIVPNFYKSTGKAKDGMSDSRKYHTTYASQRQQPQKNAKPTASPQSVYDRIAIGQQLDVTVDKIEDGYIIVKYECLSCIIPRTDMFWCNIGDIRQHVSIGDRIQAKVVHKEQTEKGLRVHLSHKECIANPWIENEFNESDEVCAQITCLHDNGYTMKISEGVEGFLPVWNMTRFEYEVLKQWNAESNEDINVVIESIDRSKKRIMLAMPTREEVEEKWENIHQYYQEGKICNAIFIHAEDRGFWVQLKDGIEATISENELNWGNCKGISPDDLKFGVQIKVCITHINKEGRKIHASAKRVMPNPWEAAKGTIEDGCVRVIEVIGIKGDTLIVETQDNFHLIGIIKHSELSWFPLKEDDEPREGFVFYAKVMVFIPEKELLQLSCRQLVDDPWNDIYLGAEVCGTIRDNVGKDYLDIGLDNGLVARSSEFELLSKKGESLMFKVVNCNRTTQEIVVSHKSLLFDKRSEEIIKNFFKV